VLHQVLSTGVSYRPLVASIGAFYRCILQAPNSFPRCFLQAANSFPRSFYRLLGANSQQLPGDSKSPGLVLELNIAPVRFYDVYWLESDLTAAERKAYDVQVYEALRARTVEHPRILELEARCPRCYANAPIADFRGNIRQAVCPRCHQSFTTEPGHLVQALYASGGLSDAM
jgi:transcription elongation factor Elf1